MQTIVLQEPGRFERLDTPAPAAPGPGEALVRVHRIGICGTDLHAFRGRQPFFSYPRILGHELGVEIEQLGTGDTPLAVGDRCAVEPYLHCGQCVACRAGKTNCCVSLQCLGVHTDGGMRERIVVPAARLHRSQRLSLDQLALVETLGIGAHAVERAKVVRDENVLVVGAGPIGLATMQFALLAGARVIALDVRADRLEFCRARLGVHEAVLAAGDPLPELARLSGGDLPTVVFDATGSAASMRRALDYVAHGGRLVWVGLTLDDVPIPDPQFHRREVTLLASRNSTAADFRRIIGLIEAGRIDTTPWITHRVAFGRMIEAFPAWLEPESRVVKAMVELD
jgi:2-desacetyl-2-hydroxyethyl bacteriochlorophyllide A dehydrogenase